MSTATFSEKSHKPSQGSLRDRPIFICGHPKAGTSLLRAIFDSHPELIVYPEETIFFRRLLPEIGKRDIGSLIEFAEQELIHIFKWNRVNPDPSQEGYPDRDYSSIPFEKVRQEMINLIQEKYQHPGDILSAAVLGFGRASQQITPATTWWVEKSPYNEYYADRIFEWWPQARCIHILRDPRDNFVSYQRKHPDWSPEFFSNNWKKSTRAGVDNQEKYGNQRYLIVRYEDLTNTPEEYLRLLTSFLEISWDESLAAPTRAGLQWQGNSMFSDQFQSISSAPVARWKDKLNPIDATVIGMMTQPYIHTFKYLNTSDLESTSLISRWRVASWPFRRKLRRNQKRVS